MYERHKYGKNSPATVSTCRKEQFKGKKATVQTASKKMVKGRNGNRKISIWKNKGIQQDKTAGKPTGDIKKCLILLCFDSYVDHEAVLSITQFCVVYNLTCSSSKLLHELMVKI
jgi:hypothetical protein